MCESFKSEVGYHKKMRLSWYDYSQNGYYFITICVEDHKCFFGEITEEQNSIFQPKIKLSDMGKIVQQCWLEIPKHFPDVDLDEYAVMPNHLHGILGIINGNPAIVGDRHACRLQWRNRQYQKLPVIIGSFKSTVTKEINQTRITNSFFWQKSYYDHIIRNEKSLQKIREYIINNPEKWQEDIENKEFISKLKKEERERRMKNYYDRLYL